MSDPTTTPGTSGAGADDKSIADVILQFLAAVGTGIGVLGFVIFVGGAVIWTRFDAVGVPAAEAVAVVPREVLVATGASVLAPAALLALFAVAAMFLWQTWAERDDAHAMETQKTKLDDAERRCAAAAAAEQRAAADLAALAAEAPQAVRDGTTARLDEQAREAKDRADAAAKQVAELQDGIEQLRLSQLNQDHERRRRRLVVGMALLTAASLGAALLWLGFNGLLGTVIVVVVAAVTSSVALLVHRRTDKFAWLAATAFAGVGLTFAFAVYFDARGERQVVPAAVLLSDRAPVYGFLVAQRDDHVYIGTIDGSGPTETHVVELDRKKVTDLLLDAHVRRDRVAADSLALVRRLCATHGRDAVPTDGTVAVRTSAKTTPPAMPTAGDQLCTPREITALGTTPTG